MFAVIRFIYSTLAGIAVAMAIFFVVEVFGRVAFPIPAELNEHNHDDMCRYIASYPSWVLAAVIPMWLGLAYGSTYVAAWLGNLFPGIVVGTLVILLFGWNVVMLPYPVWWFPAAILIGFPIMVFLALFPYIWPASTKPAKPALA
jgi:hypothetical protein